MDEYQLSAAQAFWFWQAIYCAVAIYVQVLIITIDRAWQTYKAKRR